ncbi:hypothetical protein LFL97_28490 [Burkholderia sp. JSH-S8]|uniref:hypothetical protein n=1 Tax=Burkholderia stagnalis TaxID=1503054 RepID=UPI000F80E6CD|nr:hypothetical protein [Burkholderia stagnalis]WGS44532.1 hypothetical protein LFL97_28490 [Burkholderia sp. JSH-S8]
MNSPEVKYGTFRAGEHDFVNCCLVFEAGVIGDYDQAVLIGSFILAARDLVERMSAGRDVVFKEGVSVSSAFNALYDCIWNDDLSSISGLLANGSDVADAKHSVAIPIGIESFDGEMAFEFRIGGEEVFAWRDWSSKEVKWTGLGRRRVGELFRAVVFDLERNQS